jgi:phosphatidylglycerophosphatase A
MRLKEFIFTAFYSGYSPVAPGSAGTLVGMALYCLEYLAVGKASWIFNLAAVVVLFYPFLKFANDGELFFGKKDPPEVVLDEIMGYWISILFYPFNITVAVSAFIFFRIIDILKPYPIRRLQRLNGGLGIMIDDCVAGLYTNILMYAMIFVLKLFHINIY